MWDLCTNVANNKNVCRRAKSVKINKNFFNKFKESLILAHFWSIFPIWETGTIILENPLLSQLTLYGKIQKKPVTQSRRKYSDRKKDRQDKKTLFYRTLPATSKLLPRVQENN